MTGSGQVKDITFRSPMRYYWRGEKGINIIFCQPIRNRKNLIVALKCYGKFEEMNVYVGLHLVAFGDEGSLSMCLLLRKTCVWESEKVICSDVYGFTQRGHFY